MPELVIYSWMYFPILAPGTAAIFLYLGLTGARKGSWVFTVMGAMLLFAGWFLAYLLSLGGGLFGAAVLIQIILGGIVSLVSALVLVVLLPHWRKLVALVLVLYPAALYGAINLSTPYNTDTIQKRNAATIIDALESYRARTGSYPDSLNALVPTELDSLPDQYAMWGWLYTHEKDNFVLGYVNWIDREGYGICFYTRNKQEENCGRDFESPFKLPPTPYPDWRPGTPLPP